MAVALSLFLITVDHRSGRLESFRGALTAVVYPLQYLIDMPVKSAEWIGRTLVMHKTLVAQNTKLRAQNVLLKTQSQKFAALRSENKRLRELLESSIESSERVLVADLMSVELDPAAHYVVINKGSKQGVYLGQPVVDSNGVMGQVIHVGPFSATSMLITDISHAFPVEVNRSGTRAVAMGTGIPSKLSLSYVPVNADIQRGDLIVSSGLGGRFPEGYPVGKVSEVVMNPSEPFARVVAKPLAKLAQAREVLLVWPAEGEPDISQPKSRSVAAR